MYAAFFNSPHPQDSGIAPADMPQRMQGVIGPLERARDWLVNMHLLKAPGKEVRLDDGGDERLRTLSDALASVCVRTWGAFGADKEILLTRYQPYPYRHGFGPPDCQQIRSVANDSRHLAEGWRQIESEFQALAQTALVDGSSDDADRGVWYLGNATLSVAGNLIQIPSREADVLESLLKKHGSASLSDFGDAGYQSAALAAVKRLQRRLKELGFPRAIERPGKKGGGGYRTSIIDRRQK